MPKLEQRGLKLLLHTKKHDNRIYLIYVLNEWIFDILYITYFYAKKEKIHHFSVLEAIFPKKKPVSWQKQMMCTKFKKSPRLKHKLNKCDYHAF